MIDCFDLTFPVTFARYIYTNELKLAGSCLLKTAILAQRHDQHQLAMCASSTMRKFAEENLITLFDLFDDLSSLNNSKLMVDACHLLREIDLDFMDKLNPKSIPRNAFVHIWNTNRFHDELMKLFVLTVRWAKHQMPSQSDNPKELQKCLGSIVNIMPLPCLSSDYVREHVLTCGLFTDTDKEELIQFMKVEGLIKKRNLPKHSFLRRFQLFDFGHNQLMYMQTKCSQSQQMPKPYKQRWVPLSLSFKTSHDAMWTGFSFNVMNKYECAEFYNVEIIDEQGHRLCWIDQVIFDDLDCGRTYDYQFNRPLRVLAGRQYTITGNSFSPCSYECRAHANCAGTGEPEEGGDFQMDFVYKEHAAWYEFCHFYFHV